MRFTATRQGKKSRIRRTGKSLNRAAPPAISAERDLNELEKLKRELNGYAQTLREPAGKIYPSLYSLYGVKEKNRIYFESKGMKMPRFKFQDPETWETAAWIEAESILEKNGAGTSGSRSCPEKYLVRLRARTCASF
ncbi:hypothetical protein [Methanosarcina horonobensis]|uniref:hypothetical protein n=1 Tax=Methanosarcina horonobensis TaxID=418008 RepID=UPI000AABF2EA|nr:hypothetical protein [Methanosarcina horonobensis]